MIDDKGQVSEAPATTEATVEAETTGQESLPAKQTAEGSGTAVDTQIAEGLQTGEKTVPYGRFAEINKKYRELQRSNAEKEGQRQLEGYDPNDIEAVLGHPFVQELMIKQAKQELTDYARTILEDYPNVNSQLKKAILSNARGFVNETTTDVETAKLDLLEYIESVVEDEIKAQTPLSKGFPVASTNVPTINGQGSRPAEISKILEKPVMDWSEEEARAVEDYQKTNPKK